MTKNIITQDILVCVLSHNASNISLEFLKHFSDNTDSSLCHILWIDNGSSDNSPKLLANHFNKVDNMTLCLFDENLGVIGGRNKGFEWLFNHKFKYFCILDNDQFVQNGWLEQHLSVLNSGYDIIGVEAWQMNATFLPIHKNIRLNEHFTYIGCGGSLMRVEVPEKIGIYDEQFNPAYFEDPDFIFRAYQNDFKIGWNFKSKIVHLPHQTLGNQQDKNQNFVNSLQKFRKKWKGFHAPIFHQPPLDAFENK